LADLVANPQGFLQAASFVVGILTKSAGVGDTFGDLFKNASCSSLNILIKVLTINNVLIAAH
jgi:Na+/H+-translocating membrane pyrophosphatase